MMISITTRPGPPALLWEKDESCQRGFQLFLGGYRTYLFLCCINNSTLRCCAGQSHICANIALLSKYPHVLLPPPAAIILIGVQVITEYWEDLLWRGEHSAGGERAGGGEGEAWGRRRRRRGWPPPGGRSRKESWLKLMVILALLFLSRLLSLSKWRSEELLSQENDWKLGTIDKPSFIFQRSVRKLFSPASYQDWEHVRFLSIHIAKV